MKLQTDFLKLPPKMPVDLENLPQCCICIESNELRVLQCGHGFCLNCLETSYQMNGDKIPCPMCRRVDERMPRTLPKPDQFQGQLFISAPEDKNRPDLTQLYVKLVKFRKQTINHLRNIASTLDNHEYNGAIAKIAGSSAGLIGAVLAIVGISLSFTGVGAIAGVPIAATGAGIGVAGGITTGVTVVVETVLKKIGIKQVEEDLKRDFFNAERIKIILSRAADDPDFAARWQIDLVDGVAVANLIQKVAKLGITTAIGMLRAVGRVATAGLHVAGLVLSAIVIPFDIAQLIFSSIKIHTKKPSALIEDFRSKADTLEKDLKVFLIENGNFQLVFTRDGWWTYIVVNQRQLRSFRQRIENDLIFAQLEEFGDIIESGKGDIPTSIQQKMQDEWYSHHNELKQQILKETRNL